MIERRLLQLCVVIGSFSPLVFGSMGIVHGPHAFGRPSDVPIDLDSHFHYLTGIFFATGIGFLTCVRDIERKTARFQLLGGLIVVGGLSRWVSFLTVGTPSIGHQVALAMETGVMPLLMLWQWRVARASVHPVTA
jgi:hypothetical protein